MNLQQALQVKAETYLVGGVSAGWNAFPVSGPIRFKKASGAYLYDVEGNEYIDWVVGWGSHMLGHNPPQLRDAMLKAFDVGFGLQAETEYHIQLAQHLCQLIPCAEKVRFANSGLESTLYAIRLARAHTGKNKVIKFEGHFHGLHDYLLFDMDTSPHLGRFLENGDIESVPGSYGIPDIMSNLVITLPFNDLQRFHDAVKRHKHDLAAVILEPIALNMGCVKPDPEFIKGIRQISKEEGFVLIFDEVMTGFRNNIGGAQVDLGITPDLACFSKAMSNGFPVGAVVGKEEIMINLSPVGPVQMSGTNTGRLLGIIGTLASLESLKMPQHYEHVHFLNDYFVKHCRQLFERFAIPVYVDGYGGRIGIFVGMQEKPKDLRHIIDSWDSELYLRIYQKVVSYKRLFGFLLPLPNCPEPVTLCAVHTQEDIDETLDLLENALSATV